jgi:hypothetical protein
MESTAGRLAVGKGRSLVETVSRGFGLSESEK